MKGKLSMAKFDSLRNTLVSEARSLIVVGKQTQKLSNKKTYPVKWITQYGDFMTTYKTNVKIMPT